MPTVLRKPPLLFAVCLILVAYAAINTAAAQTKPAQTKPETIQTDNSPIPTLQTRPAEASK